MKNSVNSKWTRKNLGDICIFSQGTAFPKHFQGEKEGDYPFIKVSDLSLSGNERYINTANNWITKKALPKIGARLHPPGAIVFAKIGIALTYNRRRIVKRPTVIDNNMMSAMPKENEVDRLFLYYLLCTIDFNLISSGTALPYLNVRDLKNLPVFLPPLPEQKAIAHILGTLDDKIELNRRMNETLEEMAKAIFKSWFVDFDPVIDNALKAGNPIPDALAEKAARRRAISTPKLSPEIARLFPDSFEDSPFGPIPKGWRVGKIGEILELAYGKALKEEKRQPGNVPVYGSNGQVGWHNQALVDGPGIVVGRKGHPGTVKFIFTSFYPIDTTFYVIPKGPIKSFFYLYYSLYFQDLKSLAADSAVPGLNRNVVYMNHMLVPPLKLLLLFDKVIESIFRKIKSNEEQNNLLTTIRDTILPKLISGQIRIKDAERFVEKML